MADYEYITTSGVIVPDTAPILGEVQTEYQTAFGSDLVISADTPQGVLMTAEALARAQVVQNNAALANQINPNISGGVYLDAIMALLGLKRIAQTRTLVQAVLLTGVAGTTIAAGTQAQSTLGDVYNLLNTVVLDSTGQAIGDFVANSYGPISCPSNTLVQVVTNVLGWETVTNANAGILGQNTQADQAARAYRNNVLAFQAVSLDVAATSALYNVQGVTSLSYRTNVAPTTQVIDGISLAPKSVWACVQGGSNLDIAAALLENKSSGAAWNGAVSVAVVEPASGQVYTVLFDRPAVRTILVRVTSPNGDSNAIKQAVLDYVGGKIPGLAGYIVGAEINPYEIGSAIIGEIPGVVINKVEVSYTPTISYVTSTLAIAINQIAATALSNITVQTS